MSREISVGNVKIGGKNPIVVQSMAKTDTRNVLDTIAQIHRLEEAGCEIVRISVLDKEAALSLGRIKRGISIPLIADIHFDHRLALLAIEEGVDGLRINPGTIRGEDKLRLIVETCKERGIPIRIGINSGSLKKEILKKYGGASAEAMVESAMEEIRFFEGLGFYHIKVSLKSSDVPKTVEAYRLIAKLTDYPLHLGITEAGLGLSGVIKSAVGIGSLLSEGIGDTIRVSLTDDPVKEIEAGYEILKSLRLRERGPEIISCPTCGRCEIDLISLATKVKERLASVSTPFRIAVMGCSVNGPGEAKEADIGIAGGKGVGVLFKRGKVIKRLKEADLADGLMEEIKRLEEI